MSDREQFIEICNLTTSVLDLPKDSLSLKLRDRPIALAREIAGVIGLKQGIDRKIVAKVLNKHRTATYHYSVIIQIGLSGTSLIEMLILK